MKLKKKMHVKKARKKGIPAPPIPPHAKMNFNNMGLYGEKGTAHFANLPEGEQSEGSIMWKQIAQRGPAYTKRQFAKNVLFSLVCGSVVGTAAFYALGMLFALDGILLYAIAGAIFVAVSAMVFGTSATG